MMYVCSKEKRKLSNACYQKLDTLERLDKFADKYEYLFGYVVSGLDGEKFINHNGKFIRLNSTAN